MSSFNSDSRTKNSIKNSIICGTTYILKILLNFLHRTVFIYCLSAVYLGINGLFTNILLILSLAELGITSAIVFRFYKPISCGDTHYVGMLMNYFGKVYHIIAIIIFVIGLALVPFLPALINSADSVPADINLYVVYLLFLMNTVSSYVFSYKLSLLNADQRQYLFSIIDLAVNLFKIGAQITVLLVLKNYTLSLLFGIIATLFVNFISSLWVTKKYQDVFAVKEMLPKQDQKLIMSDTKACMCHKIGGVVLSGTDNIILTKMISLVATGLYSNYILIITCMSSFISQILGNFTASLGNASQSMSKEDYYKLYKKMTFTDLWIAGVVFVGMNTCIGDFIKVWIGEKYLFDKNITIILCIQMYISLCRVIQGSFIYATGLFVRDKVRPLIEASLNLVISIILTKYYGIVGVFFGTIISQVLTAFWREPYLLYKYSFKRSPIGYWTLFAAFTVITFANVAIITFIKASVTINNIWGVLLEGALSVIFANIIMILIFRKTEEYSYLKTTVLNFIFHRQ